MKTEPPKAIIFDMDGLLVHTEPFWVQAQIEILRPLGAQINEQTCAQTKGLRIDEVVSRYHRQTPWNGPSIEETAILIAKHVSALFQESGVLLDGVHHALSIASSFNIPIALASSSPHFLIQDLLSHQNLFSQFDLIVSAENDPYGKPHPSIYIRTARLLDIPPGKCVALEDSFFPCYGSCDSQFLFCAKQRKVLVWPGGQLFQVRTVAGRPPRRADFFRL